MIRLRDMTPEDGDMVRRWRNSPEVSRYMYTDHHITRDEHARWFDSTLRDPAKRYWIIRHQDSDAGVACLYDVDPARRRCSWAFYLADTRLRGKGLGGFVEFAVLEHVFSRLRLEALRCEVLASNRAVLALHEKFGFRREGCLPAHVVKSGRPVDVVCLAITREEWDARRPEIERKLNRIAARRR